MTTEAAASVTANRVVTKNQDLTPRQRVEIALRGGHSDVIPFTMYDHMVPQCAKERELRNRGLCIVERKKPPFKTYYPNIKITESIHWENGTKMVERFYETPIKTLTVTYQDHGWTKWYEGKMFKSPEDYEAMRFFVNDACFEPNYEFFAEEQSRGGEDIIYRARIPLEPIQTLMSGVMMDINDFCIQWVDNNDEIIKLHDCIAEMNRKIYPIIADSPALICNYGGNVTPEFYGPEVFEQYYVPHYNEAAGVLHKKGKLIGCHFDANCGIIKDLIAKTDLDYIEAFTPAPDTDMTLTEARETWPDKVLWLNFPSSMHLRPLEEIEEMTLSLCNELDSVDGIIMGITEDIPMEFWQASCTMIMDNLDRHARENPEMYG